MEPILNWDSVDREKWTYYNRESQCAFIVYEISKLPDFTEARFSYLCKEADDRAAEVAKKQMQMLRQFHGLGEAWGISLRLIKTEGIKLYLIFRYAGREKLEGAVLKSAQAKIESALMHNEYTFKAVAAMNDAQEYQSAPWLDVLWATEAAEITKYEQEYTSDEYPDGTTQSFYVPFGWTSTDNSMEYICRTLLKHQGTAAVDITLNAAEYLAEEKQWMNICMNRMKECMNGETIKSATGKILWQGKKLPGFKVPVDNCERMNKQYDTSRVFLSSVRIFADHDSEALANALLVNSVRNEGNIQIYRKGFGIFEYMTKCYARVDISAAAHTIYWNRHEKTGPLRAQRLNRLISLEEAANFFRIPIPIKPGFPGFAFDTGLDDFSGKKKARSIIRLGNYLDEPGSQNLAAEFDSQQFAKHGLIVGVPGSGKTTAMFNILYQFWAVPDEQKIPFIILEPAKTEYRALKTLPEFKDDLLVFTLGDEGVSPFRFNPMEVLPGIKIENHISKLQACFVGAFDLFDPLPIFLEQAIRRTYLEKGWYEDSKGGEPGLETPTLSDLCRNAEYIVSHSGFDSKMRSDFQASLLERLNSLRRGSKGRMLDTPKSIPMEELMGRPVVLELDSLNGDEKSLMMMFLLSYVYEYCKVQRKSGSPLKHMLLVEEAHNLISAQGGGSDDRANPKAQTIELFVNMLAEMRALGQGILIADQLPTAIASQAVKQTNVKVLMRMTAKDDREEIGNTMDLNEEQMHQVVNFKTGHAYLYHEGEDRVRAIRMVNFKGEHQVEEPPSDEELKEIMADYEQTHKALYMPYPQCSGVCDTCNRRVRNQAESFVNHTLLAPGTDPYTIAFKTEAEANRFRSTIGLCGVCRLLATREVKRIKERYHHVGECFGECVYIHLLNHGQKQMHACEKTGCKCLDSDHQKNLELYKNISRQDK